MFLGDLIQSRHPCHDRRGCSRTSRHTKIADLWKYCRWVLLLHLGPRRLLYTVAVGIIQELLWLMCAFANSILHSAATSGLRWALDDDLLLGVEVSQWTQPVFLTGTTALNRKYCMDLFFGGYVFVCCRRFLFGSWWCNWCCTFLSIFLWLGCRSSVPVADILLQNSVVHLCVISLLGNRQLVLLNQSESDFCKIKLRP